MSLGEIQELYKNNFYPTEKKFYDILKDNGIKKTHKEVKEFIESQAVNQIHKVVQNVPTKQQIITSNHPNHIWQIDLIDYSKYSKQNSGFHWALVAIDFYTRKAYAEPIKNKTPPSVLVGIETIIKRAGAKPSVIYSDQGNEYKGVFATYLKNNEIYHQEDNSKNHHSFAIVDRFCRTIKTVIARVMTGDNTTRWISKLQNVIDSYNNTPHSGILGIKPNEADSDENILLLGNLNWQADYHNAQVIKSKKIIKVGNNVRIKINKGDFGKGYSARYSTKMYEVTAIENGKYLLDNNKLYNKNELLVVENSSSESNQNDAVEKADKEAKINKQLKKAGVL